MKNFNLFILIFVLASCAGGPKRSNRDANDSPARYDSVPVHDTNVDSSAIPSEQYGPKEVYGPEVPAEGVAPAPAPAPVEPQTFEPKLCVVLGPGMAKAIAHAPVLEAMKKASIPIHCIVGSEMGGVVAALYAFYGGSANNLQWQLFKFHKDNYFSFPVLTLREPKSSGKSLNDFLRNIFRGKKIEDLPIKFATVATEPASGSAVDISKGDVADALSATLAMPTIFEPWQFDGNALVSGAVSSPAPVDLAKQLGGNFIVYSDVVEDSAGAPKNMDRFQKSFVPVKSLVRMQKKEASFVITIRTGALPFEDFNRQGDYLAAGTKAAEANIASLKAAWEKFVATKP